MADKKPKTRGLGRGLSALMADVEPQESEANSTRRADTTVPIENIVPNPDQPRRTFTQDQLDDLANSIRTKGVLQPLIVRPSPKKTGTYEIVAGERRWRAAQIAKLHELPVLIREFTDLEVLEVAIIENIQREDLNPVEEAAGFRQLMDKFGHTQEALAEALGKSRSHIANQMRLLQLPDTVLALLSQGKLSAGHARALITSDHQQELAQRIVADGLSVRDTERLVKKYASGDDERKSPAKSGGTDKDADTKALEGDLSAALGMKVQVNHSSGGESGAISIKYKSLDQLDDLCRILTSG